MSTSSLFLSAIRSHLHEREPTCRFSLWNLPQLQNDATAGHYLHTQIYTEPARRRCLPRCLRSPGPVRYRGHGIHQLEKRDAEPGGRAEQRRRRQHTPALASTADASMATTLAAPGAPRNPLRRRTGTLVVGHHKFEVEGVVVLTRRHRDGHGGCGRGHELMLGPEEVVSWRSPFCPRPGRVPRGGQ
jgi:hypothetical protein